MPSTIVLTSYKIYTMSLNKRLVYTGTFWRSANTRTLDLPPHSNASSLKRYDWLPVGVSKIHTPQVQRNLWHRLPPRAAPFPFSHFDDLPRKSDPVPNRPSLETFFFLSRKFNPLFGSAPPATNINKLFCYEVGTTSIYESPLVAFILDRFPRMGDHYLPPLHNSLATAHRSTCPSVDRCIFGNTVGIRKKKKIHLHPPEAVCL